MTLTTWPASTWSASPTKKKRDAVQITFAPNQTWLFVQTSNQWETSDDWMVMKLNSSGFPENGNLMALSSLCGGAKLSEMGIFIHPGRLKRVRANKRKGNRIEAVWSISATYDDTGMSEKVDATVTYELGRLSCTHSVM